MEDVVIDPADEALDLLRAESQNEQGRVVHETAVFAGCDKEHADDAEPDYRALVELFNPAIDHECH